MLSVNIKHESSYKTPKGCLYIDFLIPLENKDFSVYKLYAKFDLHLTRINLLRFFKRMILKKLVQNQAMR